MKAGNKIRVQKYMMGFSSETDDYIVEEFRYCLGIFISPQHREAGKFTPLCELYERGCDSENKYISNVGEYTSNMVQSWMDIPV